LFLAQNTPGKRINFDNNWKISFRTLLPIPKKILTTAIATIFAKSGGAARTAIDPRFKDSA